MTSVLFFIALCLLIRQLTKPTSRPEVHELIVRLEKRWQTLQEIVDRVNVYRDQINACHVSIEETKQELDMLVDQGVAERSWRELGEFGFTHCYCLVEDKNNSKPFLMELVFSPK